MKKSEFKRKEGWALLLFLSPSFIGFGIFYIIPFIGGGYYSLLSQSIGGRFVGFHNYYKLLKNPMFQLATKNTVIFSLWSVPLCILCSLGFALLLNQKLYYRHFLRSGLIMPMVIPTASVVLIWNKIFDSHGFFNYILHSWKIAPINWSNTEWARVVIIFMFVWKNAGYMMILFLGGLQSIPRTYYELAEIEGAGKWWEFRRITLVYLTPITFFVVVISILNSFKVFREIYLMWGPYPHESVYMLQHYMNNVFLTIDYQKLTSAAYIMGVCIYAIVYGLFVVERRINENLL